VNVVQVRHRRHGSERKQDVPTVPPFRPDRRVSLRSTGKLFTETPARRQALCSTTGQQVRELRNLAERYVLMAPRRWSDPEATDRAGRAPSHGNRQQPWPTMLDAFEQSTEISERLQACQRQHQPVNDAAPGSRRKHCTNKMKARALDKATTRTGSNHRQALRGRA